MGDEVGTLRIKLEFDEGGISAKNGTTLGNNFGNAWSVAAGALIASGFQKLMSTVVSVGKSIITTGMNYEKAMSEVKAISGATAEELDRLSKKGISSASTSVFTTEQVAEAYKYMGMAGWDTAQMIDGLDGVLNLAAASNLDLGTTSDIVTDALTAFGYAASDSAHFSDVLATAATNANTDVAMMGESFKYAGAIAGAMKYNVEDVGIALGLMANSGIKASQAGTSLRSIISRMAAPTESVATAMAALGVSMTDEEGKALSLWQVMDDLRMSMRDLNETQQIEMASTIAGKNAMTGLLAIVNASDEDFYNMSEAIYTADGAAQQMANTMLDNLAGAITKMQSSWDAAKTSLFSGDFDGFIDNLTQAVYGLDDLISQGADKIAAYLPRVMSEIGLWIPRLAGTIGTAVGQLAPAIIEGLAFMLPDLVIGAVNLLSDLFTMLAAQIPTTIPIVIESIMMALEELTTPYNINQLVTSGIELILALVQGLINAIPVILESLPIIIENIVTALIDNLPLLIEAGIELVFALIDGMIDNYPVLIQASWELITTLLTTILERLPEILQMGGELVWKIITGMAERWGDYIAMVAQLPATVINTIKEKLPQILEKGKEVVKSIASGIKNNLVSALNAAKEIFDTVVNKVKEIPGEMINIGKNLVEGLWNGIKSAADWLKEKVGGFASGVVDSVKGFLGIHSPSTVFRDVIGKNLAYGIGIGFEQAMDSVAAEMTASMADSFDIGATVTATPSWVSDMNLWDELETAGGSVGGGVTIESQVFNINNELDADDIGRRMMQSIRRAA